MFVTAMDAWANQLIALALALFLLIFWVFKNGVQSQERRNWLNALALLLALVLTLWSIVLGMLLKWTGFLVAAGVLLGVPFVSSTRPDFDYLQDFDLSACSVAQGGCCWRQPDLIAGGNRPSGAEREPG